MSRVLTIVLWLSLTKGIAASGLKFLPIRRVQMPTAGLSRSRSRSRSEIISDDSWTNALVTGTQKSARVNTYSRSANRTLHSKWPRSQSTPPLHCISFSRDAWIAHQSSNWIVDSGRRARRPPPTQPFVGLLFAANSLNSAEAAEQRGAI